MHKELPGTQLIRLVDIFVLGPVLIYAGRAQKELSQNARTFLVLSGIGTILFNGWNYLRISKPQQNVL